MITDLPSHERLIYYLGDFYVPNYTQLDQNMQIPLPIFSVLYSGVIQSYCIHIHLHCKRGIKNSVLVSTDQYRVACYCIPIVEDSLIERLISKATTTSVRCGLRWGDENFSNLLRTEALVSIIVIFPKPLGKRKSVVN